MLQEEQNRVNAIIKGTEWMQQGYQGQKHYIWFGGGIEVKKDFMKQAQVR